MDGGYGDTRESTRFTLTLNVDRNRNAPEWISSISGPIQVSENLFLNDAITQINIRDLDLSVSICKFISSIKIIMKAFSI